MFLRLIVEKKKKHFSSSFVEKCQTQFYLSFMQTLLAGAATFSVITLGLKALSIKVLGIMTLVEQECLMTLSIQTLKVNTYHNNA
jgi:hypothetical protein